MAIKFFTFKKNVLLKAGQIVQFWKGHGYYAKTIGTPQVRTRLAGLMDATVKNQPNWHYEMSRPLTMPTEAQAVNGSVTSDCSFGCSILCHLAGAADPTADNWQGNSTSMFNRLTKIQKADAKVGDMVVLGTKGRLHAMMIRSLGADPTVWSHGEEAGPLFTKLSAEVSYHAQRYTDGAVTTFLRLAV